MPVIIFYLLLNLFFVTFSVPNITSEIRLENEISGTGTINPSGAPEFTPGFQWDQCCLIFSFLCSILQIVVCPFVLYLLAFIDLRILITSFVSPNFSYTIYIFIILHFSQIVLKSGPSIVFIHNDKRLSKRLILIILYGNFDI